MIACRSLRFVGNGARVRSGLLAKNNYLQATKRLINNTTRAHCASTMAPMQSSAASEAESSTNTSWTATTTALGVALLTAALGVSCTCTSSCDAPPFHVKQTYDVIKLLGEGAYGRVFLAKRKTDGTAVALKAIARDNISNDELQREVAALQVLSRNGGHPNVCRLYDLHDDGEKYYYLSLELISGGELFEHLIRNGAFSEQQAAVFLRQFAEAMSFMHSNGIVHADLKPENLMMSSEQHELAQLKVVDFGCAVMQSEPIDSKEDGVLGTTAYWSPEMFVDDPQPTEASDMWAIGCILFVLVTGSHPFDKEGGATDEEVAVNIQKSKDGQFNVFDERVIGLSESCEDLVKALLHPDPDKRMTSDEFRRHPWVQGLTASWSTVSDSDRKLEAYWQKRFRNEVLRKYAKAKSKTSNVSLSDENLRDIFNTIDLDSNGTLDPEEILIALRGLGVKDKDIADIMHSIDLDGSGVVSFDEFRTIMRLHFHDGEGVRVHHHQQRFRTKILQKFSASSVNEHNLKKIFHAIDLDGNGVLDPHEIRVVLRSVGVAENDISEIVASVDLDRSGGVDWEEFQTIMSEKFSV